MAGAGDRRFTVRRSRQGALDGAVRAGGRPPRRAPRRRSASPARQRRERLGRPRARVRRWRDTGQPRVVRLRGPSRRRVGLGLLHGRRPPRRSTPDLRSKGHRSTPEARRRQWPRPARGSRRAPRGPALGRADLSGGRRARRGTRPHQSVPRPRLVPGPDRWPRVPARRRLRLPARRLRGRRRARGRGARRLVAPTARAGGRRDQPRDRAPACRRPRVALLPLPRNAAPHVPSAGVGPDRALWLRGFQPHRTLRAAQRLGARHPQSVL
jgi:hypothetical protein